mmetsp:Transcript_15669/g.35866  ORF Transcript_15669/g.35866 Transcript_15669/m.35866 type:complete len:714 (+) Transcript_15669:255-2396(+)
MSDLPLDSILSSVAALVNESRAAKDNQEAIGELGTYVEDSIKPQVDDCCKLLRGTNEDNDNVTKQLSVLLNALQNARGVIQRRGVKRDKSSLWKLPLDALMGKAARIKGEIENAEKQLVKGVNSLSLALNIKVFLQTRSQDQESDTINVQNSYPWEIEDKDIVVERNKKGKPKSVLGSGGFATVARGKFQEQDVAVKKPHDPHAIDGDKYLKEAFYKEANILYKINHRNVVMFIGAVVKDNEGPVYAIVTEVLAMTLDQLLEKEVALEKKHSIIRDMFQGLAHLHSMGIVHRDMKPQNIMLDENGVAKIIDFGLSKQREDIQMTKNSTHLAGTEWWMSPEKKKGNRSTEASDVYSAGLVAYFLLTGKIPSKDVTQDKIEEDLLELCYADGDDIYPQTILNCIHRDAQERSPSATVSMFFFQDKLKKQGGGVRATTVDLSRLDVSLVTQILSYLGTSLELRNLALTCRAFRWQQPATGQDLSLVEEVARRVVCSGRNDVEGARITLSPYVRGTTTWLSVLRESEDPLKFDVLLGSYIEHANERKTSVRTRGASTAVASSYVMESGIHYVEFQITEGNPLVGIVRPMPNLDPDSYEEYFSFYDNSRRDDFLAARTVEWGTGNVHMCDYDCGNGAMSWTSWDNEGEDFAEWDGMEGCDAGDAVGMLINLDEGALVVYKNNRRLGVMKDGLSGSYCWCAYDSGTSALTIERCDPPLA